MSESLESVALGAVLKLVMRDAGFSQSEMAAKLAWSESKVCRTLQGKIFLRPLDITAWLDQCGVVDERQRHQILGMRLPCPACGCRFDHDDDETQ